MRLRVVSDLHIEHHAFALPRLPHDAETVLVLAGDVCELRRPDLLAPFLREVGARFRALVYVPGNHEFYGGVWPTALAKMAGWRLPSRRLHVLDRRDVVIEGVAFVGATLWTDFGGGDKEAMARAEATMFDYRAIRMPGATPAEPLRPLAPAAVLQDHLASRRWLAQAVARHRDAGRRVVLVAHHGLALDSIHARFAGSDINTAFVSDLGAWLRELGPDLAVHGHVHNSFDYRLGRTRVLVNPRGYPLRDGSVENPEFDPELVVDLG